MTQLPTSKTHKIAILLSRDLYTNDYDNYELKIIESITSWEEVSDEDYKSLKKAAPYLGYTLIEQPTDLKKWITKTIAEWKVIAEKREKDERIRLAAKEAKRSAAKKANDAKTLEQKKKLLIELQKELSV